MIPLRDYQQEIVNKIKHAWLSVKNVLAVQATRTGKTVVFADVIAEHNGHSCAIAHRQELISQISIALARCRVPHRIMAPDNVIKRIIKLQIKETGSSYYNPSAKCTVAGANTLLSRKDTLKKWAQTVTLWVIDEGHHVVDDNMWGKIVAMFTNARGLLVTATPSRADGKGLGRHADGVADDMVIGLQAREAIHDGWLLDYKIYCPQGDFIRPDDDEVGSNGEFKKSAVKNAIRNSHIIGDVVKEYKRFAMGKIAICYAPDVETATALASDFNLAGIPSAIVSAKTPDLDRAKILEQARRREILVLLNVDLFGEGVDLKEIEVVIMARPTESLSLYAQQFNRASTIAIDGPIPDSREDRLTAIAASNKPYAIIIDHVGNVLHFGGPPDAVHNQQWTLDARDRKSRGVPADVIPLTNCLNPACAQPYERFYPACPYCGYKPIPTSRSAPEFVDGDLTELDPAVLAVMRGEVEQVDLDPMAYREELRANHCPEIGQHAHVKRHITRQEKQTILRESMAWWAGYQPYHDQQTLERLFYHTFKIDALSAKALGVKEADDLIMKINSKIMGI